MTLYAVVDDEDLGQVATTKGWSDLFEWADAQGYFQLAHLVYHGYATDLELLAREIEAAIRKSNPRPDVETTARGIQEICWARPDGKVLIVTDGTGGSDEDFDEDEEEDDDS